ncbi:MAG TPA: hypothetical protein VGR69_09965 [Candidatus Rubrimentiphilum sp.]|nr:hypothetical protein [Candidatus Rubrimentiphilum sp.]
MGLVGDVVRSQSSIGRELLWLLFFFVLFIAISALWVPYASAHHFNDRIAIVLSGLVSALLMIAIRARVER